MSDNKDYSKLALDELLTEEKKIKKAEITSAVLIGFLIGVIVYGVAKNGFGFLYIFIPLLLIAGIAKNAQKLKQKLKQIRAEISAKSIE
jgi:F0F1-type ATP synthase assembly protein I